MDASVAVSSLRSKLRSLMVEDNVRKRPFSKCLDPPRPLHGLMVQRTKVRYKSEIQIIVDIFFNLHCKVVEYPTPRSSPDPSAEVSPTHRISKIVR